MLARIAALVAESVAAKNFALTCAFVISFSRLFHLFNQRQFVGMNPSAATIINPYLAA
jgi:hypothetical protein